MTGATRTGHRPLDVVVGAYLALLAVAAVQTLVLDDPWRTVLAAVPYLVALVGYLAALRLPAHRLLTGLGVALTALAGATVLAFAAALPAGLDDPSGFYRVKVLVTTLAGDHNTVGGLLLPGVAATCTLARRRAGRWWAPAAVLCTLGVVASLSRSAAVVLLAAGLAGLAVPRIDRTVAALTAAAGAAATAAVTALAALLGAAPPATAGTGGILGASLTGRVDLIVRGAETTVEHPLLGVGLSRFVDAADGLPWPNFHAHNALAHLGAEAGLVGFAVALTLTATLVVRALRTPPGPVRDVAVLGGAALLAHAQVDVHARLWSYELLLAVLLALAVRRAPEPGEERSRLAASPQAPPTGPR